MSDEPPEPIEPDRLEQQRGKPGPGGDDFDPKSHIWDGKDWWSEDRQFWWDGSRWQSKDVPHEGPPPMTSGKRSAFSTGEFWLGFAGTIVGNIVLAVIVGTVSSAYYGNVGAVITAAPWVLNIGALVIFAIVRPRVAGGMLLAYGVALALALLAGIFVLIVCFSASGSGGVP